MRRSTSIDLLRGIAILMVLACHSIFIEAPSWNKYLIQAGWSGVDLFFVVSGFLISSLLFAEYRQTGQIQFKRFFIRRAFKIYPPFYSLVALTVVTRFVFSQNAAETRALARRLFDDIFFLQSYREGTYGHFWSLSVEEHFYILLPVLLYFLTKRQSEFENNPFSILPKLFGFIAICVLGMRLWTARYVQPFAWQTHLFPTHLRADSLLFGVTLSYWYHFHRAAFDAFIARHRPEILIGAAICLLPLFFIIQYDPWMYTWGFASLYLGYGALLVGLLDMRWNELPRVLQKPVNLVAHIGTYSYSIYLWHILWIQLFGPMKMSSTMLRLAIYYAGALAVGIATAKMVELPTLKIRDRLFPRPVASIVST